MLGAEGGVAAVDDLLQIGGGDLGLGNVKAEDLEGQLGVGKVLPALLLMY